MKEIKIMEYLIYRIAYYSAPYMSYMKREIGELVQKLAAEKGLEVELVRFSDFILPNAALADGDINVNSFQHLPYLEAMMKDRGYKLVSIGKTVLMPLGVYSETVKSLDVIKNGMTVAISPDATAARPYSESRNRKRSFRL